MFSRKNATHKGPCNQYVKRRWDGGLKVYSHRQSCMNYTNWCEQNKETLHLHAVIGQKMEVDFVRKSFHMTE